GQGGDGANGYSIGNQNLDGQSGGHAGAGSGVGYGGAIACVGASNPVIRDCTISDNSAEGGAGGDGGNGSTRGNNSNGKESWGGDGGDASGEGKGGGVYAADGCRPVMTGCTVSDNQARPGSPGEGGVTGPGSSWANPYNNASDGRNGFYTPIDTSLGGAIYCDDNADMYIAGSTFSGNRAFDVYFYQQTFITEDGFETETVEMPTYTRGGALYGSWNNALEIRDSEFSENMAGALYFASDCDLDMMDCLIRGNKTRDDAISYDFFYYYYYTYQIPMEPTDTPSGGLYVGPSSAVDVNDCTFASNYTHANGAAVTCKTDANFQRCAFADNTAYGTGGAIDVQYEDDYTVVLTASFFECSFAQNQAKLGGAMRIRNATGRFTDCYFAENRASHGGGMYVDAGDVSINGGVIFGNKAMDRAGVGGGVSCVDSSAYISDCILQD
ncbi:MAG: right-handed parallel beta-helix repeat-containing protein, partial [Planctomycetes bacterium]|nr:right-handed parallel beta-helix repeat-containing protein [Planctomycetota bacterium]